MNIKEFFEQHGSVLKQKALSMLKPLSNIEGGEMDETDRNNLKRLGELNRKPFYAQATTINSLAKAFYKAKRKALILVGEMGTGKTLIGSAVAYLNPKENHRTLIICPPHLVKKWEREILTTVPGSKVRILEKLSDISLVRPIGREFWVFSREKAKLQYKDRIAVGRNSYGYHCQKCGERLVMSNGGLTLDKDEYKSDAAKAAKRGKCPHCGEVLRQPLLTYRRYSLAKYIKQHKSKCGIDLLIADEMHEFKSSDSAQGDAFHQLCSASKKVLGMTGTLMGGKSSDLFYLLFRMFPRKMVGHGYAHDSAMKFCHKYGVVETHISIRESGSNRVASLGKDSSARKTPSEKPGVSPILIPNFLLEDSIFLFIDDICASMPPYTEYTEMVEMDEEQYEVYKDFESSLIQLVRQTSHNGAKSRFLGALVQSLYALPDAVRKGEEVYDPQSPDKNSPVVVLQAPALNIPMTAKEERLLEIVEAEKAQGRRCAVFLEHTGTRDLVPDLVERLENAGLKTLVLRSNSPDTQKREAWITRHVQEDNPDVLICHPKNVQTGLDLLEFPTIVYFQTGYSIYTLRQSSRRSWRIGQDKPVRVYYMAYRATAQERALRLIAQKLETSNAVEGRLSADGLSAMSESQDSMLYELARSIMEGTDDKTSVTEIWGKKAKSSSSDSGYLVAESGSLRDEVMELMSSVSSKRKIVAPPSILTLENFFGEEDKVVEVPKITITPKPTPKSEPIADKAMQAGMKLREVKCKKGASYKVFDLEAYFNAVEA